MFWLFKCRFEYRRQPDFRLDIIRSRDNPLLIRYLSATDSCAEVIEKNQLCECDIISPHTPVLQENVAPRIRIPLQVNRVSCFNSNFVGNCVNRNSYKELADLCVCVGVYVLIWPRKQFIIFLCFTHEMSPLWMEWHRSCTRRWSGNVLDPDPNLRVWV